MSHTHTHNVAPSPSPNAFWESQSVIKSHQTPTPALPRSHTPSQSRTKSKPQHFLRVAKCHKVAPGPNPGVLLEVTEHHNVAPGHSLGVTQRHKVAPGCSLSASSDSHSVAKSHVAPTPAHSACRKASSSRFRPKPQSTLSVTKCHRFTPRPTPAPSPSAFCGSQSVTHPHQAKAPARSESHKA